MILSGTMLNAAADTFVVYAMKSYVSCAHRCVNWIECRSHPVVMCAVHLLTTTQSLNMTMNLCVLNF
jgi:hypothetical protein